MQCDDPAAPICDVSGDCIPCAIDMNGMDPCDPGLFCNMNGECEAPTCGPSDGACTEPTYPRCDEGQCLPCMVGMNGPCEDLGSGQPYCIENLENGTSCGECRDGTDCDPPLGCVNEQYTNVCGGCSRHDECGSEVCLNGVCLDYDHVLFVASAGDDMNDCQTRETACATIATALTFIAPGDDPKGVKVLGDASAIYTENLSIPMSRVALIGDGMAVGEGATIRADVAASNSPVISVPAGANLSIEKLTVAGAVGDENADGITCTLDGQLSLYQVQVIDNASQGIFVDECAVTVTRSLITNNANGGIRIYESSFNIRNNFIVSNGDVFNSGLGGVEIENGTIVSTATQFFDFNTLARNAAEANDPFFGIAGLKCATSVPFDSHGNIISRNVGTNIDLETACRMNYSNVVDISISDGNGEGNINVLPTFVDANGGDFHLSESDEASRDVEGLMPPYCADGTCVDYDGDARPIGDRYDMGADEYIPPT